MMAHEVAATSERPKLFNNSDPERIFGRGYAMPKQIGTMVRDSRYKVEAASEIGQTV